jgi:hypothetical protein
MKWKIEKANLVIIDSCDDLLKRGKLFFAIDA